MSIKNVETNPAYIQLYGARDKAFFHVQQRMLKAFDEIEAKRQQVTDKESLAAYLARSKKVFRETMGALPYDPRLPFDTKVTKVIEEKGLTIQNLLFRTRKNVYISANLYLPNDREACAPAVLLQCGHSENGKCYQEYQKVARRIAARGIIVLVTDPLGQGERQQYLDENGTIAVASAVPHHQMCGTPCFQNGENLVKYFLADALRSVDFLCALEGVDKERIGATGNSGGGTMTSLLMAYDDRIKAAAPSCWPCAGKEYFLSGGAADSEQIWPNILKNGIDVFEIMACMCPKPLVLLGASYDFIPFEGVERLYDETKRLYTLAGNENGFQMVVANEPHGFSEPLACAASDFFAEAFASRKDYIEEISLEPLSDSELYATESGLIVKDYQDDLTVRLENLAEYKAKAGTYTEKEKRDALEALVYNGRPKVFKHNLRCFKSWWSNYFCDNDTLWVDPYVWFTQEFLPCHGIMFKSAENKEKNIPVTLCLWTDGTTDLENNADEIRAICASGRAAFVLDLTAMGKNLPHRMKGSAAEKDHVGSISDKIAKALFMLGDSLGAIQAYDLMQAILLVKEHFSKDVAIYTKGNYSILARIAQKLDPTLSCRCENEVKVKDIIENQFYPTDDLSHVIIPNIAQYID